ncbi:MAG: hypothetical protein PUD33_02250 [Treponema sp.]|nr:hypothetical protein [Treponema sp.]
MKKKFKKIAEFFSLGMVFAVLFFGCAQNDSNDNSSNPATTNLEARLLSAKAGEEIDIQAEGLTVDSKVYEISKSITIKNGDVNNSAFILTTSGITLENLSNVKSIKIDEKDSGSASVRSYSNVGKYFIKNCTEITSVLVVNGENSSISISKTQVTTLSVEQENSLIQLEETTISKTFVSKDCKLDSVSGDTSFGSVYVQKTVEKIELAGSAKIEKMLASFTEEKEFSVVISSESVKIESAVSVIKEKIQLENVTFDKNAITEAEFTEEEKEELSNMSMNFEGSMAMQTFIHNDEFNIDVYDEIEVKSDEFYIEKTSSGTIITNKNPKTHAQEIWDNYVVLSGINNNRLEKGKNYKVSVDIKSDKDCYIVLEVNEGKIYPVGIKEYVKLSKEYETYSINTGTLPLDFENLNLTFAAALAEKIYVKNIKIEEIDTPSMQYGIWYGSDEDLADKVYSVDGSELGKYKVTFKRNLYSASGPDLLLNKALKVNSFVKVKFTATSDSAAKYCFWLKGNANTKLDSGGNKLFSAGEKQTLEFYFPVYQETDEEYRIPYLWLSVDDENITSPVTITIEDIEVTESSIEEAQSNNPALDFYFAGMVNGAFSVVNACYSVPIMPNSFINCQFLLSDAYTWDYRNLVTTFRTLSENQPINGSSIKAEDYCYKVDWGKDNNFFIKNDSNEIKYVKFSLDDEFKVQVTESTEEECCGRFNNLVYAPVDRIYGYGIKFTQEDNNLTGECTLSARIRDEQAPSSAYIDAFVTKSDGSEEWIIIQDINIPCENQKVNFEYQLNEGESVSGVYLMLKNVIAVINQ